MSFTRINPSGWAVGDKYTSAQANAIDIQLATALDKSSAGDALQGPVSVGYPYGAGRIVAAGANGVQATAQSAITSLVAGGIAVNLASGIATNAVGGLCLAGGSADWPTFGNGGVFGLTRTLARVAPCVPIEGILIDGSGASIPPSQPLNISTVYNQVLPTTFGQQSFGMFATLSVQSNQFKSNAFCIVLNPYLQDGATLTTATLNYFTSTKSALPFGQPFLGLYRTPAAITGGTGFSNFPAMGSVAQDNAATVGAYSNQSRALAQSITTNSVIDRSQYLYIAVVGDEYGTNATSGNTFGGITLQQIFHDLRPG
jgi:hypothetical protein